MRQLDLHKALAGLFLAAQLAFAAAPGGQALADLHAPKGVTCVDCHPGTRNQQVRVDDNETVPNQSCVRCHGDLKAVGAEPAPLPTDEFAAFARAERAKWKEVVRVSGARLD